MRSQRKPCGTIPRWRGFLCPCRRLPRLRRPLPVLASVHRLPLRACWTREDPATSRARVHARARASLPCSMSPTTTWCRVRSRKNGSTQTHHPLPHPLRALALSPTRDRPVCSGRVTHTSLNSTLSPTHRRTTPPFSGSCRPRRFSALRRPSRGNEPCTQCPGSRPRTSLAIVRKPTRTRSHRRPHLPPRGHPKIRARRLLCPRANARWSNATSRLALRPPTNRYPPFALCPPREPSILLISRSMPPSRLLLVDMHLRIRNISMLWRCIVRGTSRRVRSIGCMRPLGPRRYHRWRIRIRDHRLRDTRPRPRHCWRRSSDRPSSCTLIRRFQCPWFRL
jgi:hypothetical protein